jgi:serine/threonine protein phosphatase PrpC
MGGHSNGAEASQTAIDCLKAIVPHIAEVLNQQDPHPNEDPHLIVEMLVSAAYAKADVECSTAGGPYDNRGTTMVAVFVYQGYAIFFNIGDSFGFVIDTQLKPLKITVPHENPWGGIAHCIGGEYTNVYNKHGSSLFKQPDVFYVELKDIHSLVLASDGIWDPVKCLECFEAYNNGVPFTREAVNDFDAAQIIGERGLAFYASNAAGNQDNCTVVTITMETQ